MAATTTTPAFLTLQDRVAIVTGSSCGIGKAIAINLASLGAKLVINYTSDKEQAELVAKEINSGCVDGIPRAVVVQADLSESVHVKLLFDEAKRVFGSHVHVFVNSASIADSKDHIIANTSVEDFDRIFRFFNSVNCRGAFSCCKESANQVKQGGGVELYCCQVHY